MTDCRKRHKHHTNKKVFGTADSVQCKGVLHSQNATITTEALNVSHCQTISIAADVESATGAGTVF